MKKGIKIVSLAIAAVILVGIGTCLPGAVGASRNIKQVTAEQKYRFTQTAVDNWSSDYSEYEEWQLDFADVTVNGQKVPVTDVLSLQKQDTVEFVIPAGMTGTYNLIFEYCITSSYATDCLLNISLGGDGRVGYLPMLWADSTSDYSTDRFGNETVPEQSAVAEYIKEPVSDYRDSDRTELEVVLDGSETSVSVLFQSQDMDIKSIGLATGGTIQDYSVYLSTLQNDNAGSDYVEIEGEKYSLKSDSYIRGKTVRSSDVHPYDVYKKQINAVEDNSWSTAGQQIIWEFDVAAAGCYNIALNYLQAAYTNKLAFRSIKIDGETLFSELDDFAFGYTGSGEYSKGIIGNTDGAYKIYLETGRHTISMQARICGYSDVYNRIIDLMSEISSLSMSLQKLSAGQTDSNRTWDMDAYMPDCVPKLMNFADRIDGIYEELRTIGGCTPTYADNLVYAAQTLRKLVDDPLRIPNRTELISTGDSSASKYLGTVLSGLSDTSMSIDRIIIYPAGTEPKISGGSFFKNLADGFRAFIYSFVSDYSGDYAANVSGNGESGELEVWINRSIQYVQVLQQIVDSDYNLKNNTDIRLSIMPSEQKLILSNAAGTNPDLVLGVSSSTPFNFAVRGAAKNLLDYPEFLRFYNSEYNLQALIPMCYGDGVYGANETMDFQVLFYRRDILESLGLTVPDTWDDVKKMMPTLCRNSMNFYIPLSSSAGYKGYNATTPFLHQNGGTLYSRNGVSTAIDESAAINGFFEMTDLYNIYSLDSVVPSFYNSFRYGQIPIGISGFGTYIQMMLAAPELAGMWGIAVTPGTVQEDSSILRSQMADLTACMIFDNTDKPDEAWQFLKWWLCNDTQTKYSSVLQTTYGSEYRWNTANLKSFAQLPYPEADKSVILEQWESQMENLRHPANYMVEREISNIWTNTVINGQGLIETIDSSTVTINHEIERKLREFGYLDDNGNIIKDYATNAYEMLKAKLEDGSDDAQ